MISRTGTAGPADVAAEPTTASNSKVPAIPRELFPSAEEAVRVGGDDKENGRVGINRGVRSRGRSKLPRPTKTAKATTTEAGRESRQKKRVATTSGNQARCRKAGSRKVKGASVPPYRPPAKGTSAHSDTTPLTNNTRFRAVRHNGENEIPRVKEASVKIDYAKASSEEAPAPSRGNAMAIATRLRTAPQEEPMQKSTELGKKNPSSREDQLRAWKNTKKCKNKSLITTPTRLVNKPAADAGYFTAKMSTTPRSASKKIAAKRKDRVMPDPSPRLKRNKKEDTRADEHSPKLICELRHRIQELEAVNDELMEKVESSDLARAKSEAQAASEMNTRTQAEQALATVQKEAEDLREQLAESRNLIKEHEQRRKELRNLVQDLKGNIRVFARLRPILGTDKSTSSCVQFPQCDPDRQKLTILQQTETKSWDFQFDKVFPHYSSQADVFEEIDHLVQSVIDGYKVCIFAYGQTGSGKTFTMEGGDAGTADTGMVPRAVSKLFGGMDAMLKDTQRGWTWTVSTSHLEIYNETIRDLLVSPPIDPQAKKHDIKHRDDGTTVVTDLTMKTVTSEVEVATILRLANSNRSVAATMCNDLSSRSHSVFSLNLRGKCSKTGELRNGKLTMIDLAGSERLGKSMVTGENKKEAISINKSLSSLGDVIAALQKGKSHVPFRNSKLTYLLKNTLGGDAKCLMLVHLSPCHESMQESLCSLRFAEKVNSCVIRTSRQLSR